MKKITFIKIILIVSVFLGYLSCKELHGDMINMTIEDSSRPNFVKFELTLDSAKYDKISWHFPSGETFSQLKEMTVYFPQKGEYDLKVEVTKGNKTSEIHKKIKIEQDDLFTEQGEKLVWHDEFNGIALNQDWWTNETDVRVNNELQQYTAGDNVVVRDGKLVITLRKIGDKQEYGSYTSGRVKTQGKQEFTYGRMEIRAKIPDGIGTWPAIWMLGNDIYTTNWPNCGEIDIMEHVGFDPTIVHSSLHSGSSYGNTQNSGKTKLETYNTEYHIYGLNWTPEKIEFYIDSPENIHYTYFPEDKNDDTWPFNKPYFFILNIAIGGEWGGKEGIDDAVLPKDMLVDYVRVYQK